ncbi:MAG: M28 family peptidase [Bacteroidales bacterium]
MMKFFKVFLLALFAIVMSTFIWGKIYYYSEPEIVKSIGYAYTTRIKQDLVFLTKECRFRNYKNKEALNRAADFIKIQFNEVSPRIEEQFYSNNEHKFRNIICSIGPEEGERIIIGAHYDVCENQEGADDNASGVAGLLELARLLKNENLKYRIDFVAYSTEEPPFFKSEFMGSHVHAKYLHDNHIKVKGMISLEMIGYYSEKDNSQSFPVFFLKWFYGHKGNFITVVQKFGNGDFGREFKRLMKEDQVIATKSFSGPLWLPGVDFSDHLNYWKFNYPAVMITNTAFYRNQNYHTQNDKMELLDIEKMARVVDELYVAIKKIK